MSDDKKSKLEVLQKKSKLDAFYSQAEYTKINKIYVERLERLNHIDTLLTQSKTELITYIKENEIPSLFSGSGKSIDRFEKQKAKIQSRITELDEKRNHIYREFKVAEDRYENARQSLLLHHNKSSIIDEKVEQHRIKEKEKNLYQEELQLHDTQNTIKSKNKF